MGTPPAGSPGEKEIGRSVRARRARRTGPPWAQTAAAQQQERPETETAQQTAAATRTENELADERVTTERLAGEVADSRSARALAQAEIAALQRQLEAALQAERDHAEQRLADERRQHAEYLHELQQRVHAGLRLAGGAARHHAGALMSVVI